MPSFVAAGAFEVGALKRTSKMRVTGCKMSTQSGLGAKMNGHETRAHNGVASCVETRMGRLVQGGARTGASTATYIGQALETDRRSYGQLRLMPARLDGKHKRHLEVQT
jgi:hypothetical protein